MTLAARSSPLAPILSPACTFPLLSRHRCQPASCARLRRPTFRGGSARSVAAQDDTSVDVPDLRHVVPSGVPGWRAKNINEYGACSGCSGCSGLLGKVCDRGQLRRQLPTFPLEFAVRRPARQRRPAPRLPTSSATAERLADVLIIAACPTGLHRGQHVFYSSIDPA